jgi:hypothetical protein
MELKKLRTWYTLAVDFPALSERLQPKEIVKVLNIYLEHMAVTLMQGGSESDGEGEKTRPDPYFQTYVDYLVNVWYLRSIPFRSAAN